MSDRRTWAPLGAGRGWRAYRRPRRPAKAPPAPVPFTGYRCPVTGRFCPEPGPTAARLGARRGRGASGAPVVTRRVTTWEDGEREVLGVSVRWPELRGALLRGELRAGEVRELEAELVGELLERLSPRAFAEWEREQLERAHRSDKGRRGAESRRRNAAARAVEPGPYSGRRRREAV